MWFGVAVVLYVLLCIAYIQWVSYRKIIKVLNQLDKVVQGSKNKDWAYGVEYAMEQIERTMGIWVRRSDNR